jgi:hypothetical protein
MSRTFEGVHRPENSSPETMANANEIKGRIDHVVVQDCKAVEAVELRATPRMVFWIAKEVAFLRAVVSPRS